MKKSFLPPTILWLALLLPATAGAAADPLFAELLPDPVAFVDGKPISRSRAMAILDRSLGERTIRRGELSARLRLALEEHLCRLAVRRELDAEGILIDADTAFAALQTIQRLRPPGMPPSPPDQLRKIARNEDFQLRLGVQQLMAKRFPLRATATAEEVEDFYRANQKQFLRPAEAHAEFLAVPHNSGRIEALRRVLSQIRQGVPFERAAGEAGFSPAPLGPGMDPAALVAGMNPGDARLMELPEQWVLVQLVSRTPERYWTLEEAAPHIREELAAAQSGKDLQRLIAGQMARLHLDYRVPEAL